MIKRFSILVGSSASVAALALAGASPAVGAKRHPRSTRHGTVARSTSRSRETALTGSTLSSASSAALNAVPGGTVTGASTETDSSVGGAAYEVHVTKSDGSRVVVIEDSSFNVLATQADQGPGPGPGPGPYGH